MIVAGTILIAMSVLPSQEKEKRVCGMSRLIEAQWCPKCDGVRMKSLKDEHAKPGCDGTYRSAQLCDRSDVTLYRCAEHASEIDAKPGKCAKCGKERGAVRGSIGRIAYRCDECKAEGPGADFEHREGCKSAEATAYCTESGKPAHDDLSESEDKVIQIIVRLLTVPRQKVTEAASLEKDLGADELDRVELVMAIEETLQITISDEDSEGFHTVGDILRYVRKLKR